MAVSSSASRTQPRICLITPGHVASTPRLVKHADALTSAGYDVTVVSGRHFPPAERLDRAIVEKAAWRCARVAFNAGAAGFFHRLSRTLFRRLVALPSRPLRFVARAHFAGHAALVRAATRTHADFYFGHGGVAGLAIAAAAARNEKTKFGFDAEDWHLEETDALMRDTRERDLMHRLLADSLPQATLVTSGSPLIGEAFQQFFGVSTTTLLNVFPLAESPREPATTRAPSNEAPAVFYWFSQTVGPGRGLEKMLEAMARMNIPAVLHLRGFVAPSYAAALSDLARSFDLRAPVFLPPAPAGEMARLAATAHLGVSFEATTPRNRDLCLTNKIFTYLLAGVPIALSPTRAHQLLAPTLAAAALALDGDPSVAARELDAFLSAPARQSAAREAAWRLGQERYNWDAEKQKLLDLIARHFPLSR